MDSNFHAFCIIIILVFAAIFIFKRFKKSSLKRILTGLLFSALYLFLLIAFHYHKCHDGGPILQAIYFSIILFLLVSFCFRDAFGKIATFLILFLGFIICTHFLSIIHRENFTGNPDYYIKKSTKGTEARIERLWHSFFTGIHRIDNKKEIRQIMLEKNKK